MNKRIKVLELTGQIKAKKADKVKNKTSAHYLTPFYRLTVEIDQEENINEILAFECWLERKEVWNQLVQSELPNYSNKRYYFKVRKKPGAGQVWRLVDWQELKNHGSN